MCRTINLALLFLLNSIGTLLYGQTFITMDKDTHEFIEDVNYSLFSRNQIIYRGTTLNDKATVINPEIAYDSIVFSRIGYEELGLVKSRIDSVNFLTKKIMQLDEVVIGSNADKEIILGETNRFIKRHARRMLKELDYGTMFFNGSAQKLKLNKLVLYVDKVKLKTAYRINFMHAYETPEKNSHQFAEPGEIIYATDTLFLKPKDKGKVEITLPDDFYLLPTKKMFVWIQLIDYYSKTGALLCAPEENEFTKLRFQLSKQANYYSRTYRADLDRTSDDIININMWISNDYLQTFGESIHKSELVTPAIILYGQKI